MSPERSAFPFSRLERAGLETPRAEAAAVTERPAGVIISVRMKSPGCGGFLMGMLFPYFSVVIFQVQIADFAFHAIDAERHSAVACHAKAPYALAISS